MFYTYVQNNSGGSFNYNKEQGISHFVIIEADNFNQSNEKAEKIGLYFDDGMNIDCPCCGQRWNSKWDEDGTESPKVYGKVPEEYNQIQMGADYPEEQIAVHYKDGRIEWY